MSTSDTIGAPLAEVEFLARSANRVTVLDALTEGPVDRYELEETTGVTRATLGRVLDDFRERGWVREEDRTYEATQLGAYVVREFTTLLERFEPVPALNEVAEWFPEAGFEFDLGRLVGATVVRPSRSDALAPTTHIADRLRSAERVRLVTYSVLPSVMKACWVGTVEGSLQLESVLDRGALDGIVTDPRLADDVLGMVETGQVEVVWYDGTIPSTVFVVDDVVLLCLSGGDGAPHAVIESDDETVREWAEATIDDYRREGERIDPAAFTG